MSASECDPTVVGSLAVLQTAFPVMPMPDGVISLVEAGLQRVPGISSARIQLRLEPLQIPLPEETPGEERIWLETLDGRYGCLDLALSDIGAFAPYEPYVRNLMNDVAVHVESEHRRRQLEQALAAVREADRRKDEFLGLLSHELRNPLAPIRNSLYVLDRAVPGTEQATRAKEVIRRQTEHLARLVDDLLDLKRLSTGKFRLSPAQMDLARQVRESVEDMRPVLEKRSLSLELREPDEPVWVNGDATRITQVLTNLLHNASKFTNAGGHVRVAVERRGAYASVSVRDDGVGVAPELLTTLFDPFMQSESTIHRSRGGLGLGLALVKGITELHGGTVVARSEGVGRGTEFVLTFPAVQPVVTTPAVPAPAPASSPRRVLIIENSRDAAESLRDVLAGLGGHEVLVAHDGERGVEAAREHRPDVVLCDLGLPVFDGYEVARRIRAATGAERNARLVALSGYAAPEDVERTLRAGFDYHVAKPPDVEHLLGLVGDAPASSTPATLPDGLATGHHEVDAQHAGILAEAARLRRATAETVWDSLRFLEHHAASHFEYEDKLMEDLAYRGASAHRDDHRAFAAELRRLTEQVQRDGASVESVSTLADTVERWVHEHVLGEDRRIADFIHGANQPDPERSRDTSSAASPNQRESMGVLPRRVLLVDDDDDFRESIAELLQDEGWEVTQARNGDEALVLAKELGDFVLLVDYRMPGLNGGEVFEHVRARVHSRLAAVLMTASAQVEELATRHGFPHHVGKPFEVAELFQKLESARDAA